MMVNGRNECYPTAPADVEARKAWVAARNAMISERGAGAALRAAGAHSIGHGKPDKAAER